MPGPAALSPPRPPPPTMARDHGPSIKDDEAYEALRERGYSKQKSAAIANAQANAEGDGAANDDTRPSEKGGRAEPYEEWTKDELHDRARELDVAGRSAMTKDELVGALRET